MPHDDYRAMVAKVPAPGIPNVTEYSRMVFLWGMVRARVNKYPVDLTDTRVVSVRLKNAMVAILIERARGARLTLSEWAARVWSQWLDEQNNYGGTHGYRLPLSDYLEHQGFQAIYIQERHFGWLYRHRGHGVYNIIRPKQGVST